MQGYVDIRVLPACKCRFSALPVLTYIKYKPECRFSKTAIFGGLT